MPALSRSIALLSLALALGVPALAQTDEATPAPRIERGDIVRVFSGDMVEIPRGVERRGSVVSIGGDVRIDGTLDGDVVVILGNVRVTGEVRGQVIGVLTDLTLDGARVDDQVVSILGGLERQNVSIGDRVVRIGIPGMRFPGFLTLLTWFRLAALLVVFVLLVLLVSLVPERVRAIGEDAPVRYVQAFFVGVLGYIAALSIFLLVSVTLIGGPLAYVAFVAAKWLGVAGLFYAIGRRISRGLGRELSPFAAVLLLFGVYAVLLIALGAAGLAGLAAIVVVRLVFLCLFEIPGFGLVLLTRAGARGAERLGPPPATPPVVAPAGP